MKDTFDLRKYLTENKLTEATRTERQHFGNIPLNEHVVLDEEETNNLAPESIMYSDSKLVAKGTGFSRADIEQALKQAYDKVIGTRSCASVHIKTTPAENSTHAVEVNEKGSYEIGWRDKWDKPCYTFDKLAEDLEQLVKGACVPKELEQHIKGWIIATLFNYIEVYPLLDEEGIEIYKQAEQKLADSISRFYAGSNYWGD